MSTTYGYPVLRLYDEYEQLVGERTASSAAADGSSLSFPTFTVSNLYSGAYGIIVFVRQADGSLAPIGGASIWLWGNDAPPPPPPDCTENICPDQP